MTAILEPMVRIRMTQEDFERLPEGPPFYDYINGEAIELNKPTPRHQDIELVFAYNLRDKVLNSGLGRLHNNISVKLPSGDWVGPDIVFVATENLHIFDPAKDYVNGTPDLIVEVSSPTTKTYDR